MSIRYCARWRRNDFQKLKLPKIIRFGLGALIICGIIGLYVELQLQSEKRKNLVAEIPAKIENVEIIRAVDPIDGRETTAFIDVTFTYSADGQTYRRIKRMSRLEASQFVPWSEAKVCYDLGDPTTVDVPEFFPSTYQCGK